MEKYAFKTRQIIYGILLFTVVLVVSSCGGGGGGNGGVIPQGKVTVAGIVSGSGGLVDVLVSSGGLSVKTDSNGFYQLVDVPVPSGDLLVLTYEKEGYATFQRSLSVTDGETYAVAASLLQYHHNEAMDAAQSNDLTVADPNNMSGPSLAELTFPAGSVAGSGNVTVEVAVGDPTTEAGRPTFPGDYMAATSLGGDADTPLESIVFTEITVSDSGGTELTQLNEPATVTVRLPDSLQSQYSAGGTIPWWSYDENSATWVREDADPATPAILDDAQLIDLNGDGVLYAQARVTHFTWWNVDKPITEHACVCVNVVDGAGSPLVGAQLVAEGISYNGSSRPAPTDASGRGCVTIKRSTATETERVKLYVETGNVKFYYDVTDGSAEGNDLEDEIFAPMIEGSTLYNTGECVELSNTISQRYDGVINGTVTYESSGSPVADFTILTGFGPSATTDAQGQYTLQAPIGTPISLFAVGLIGQTVTVPDAVTPVIVNFTVPNRVPVITALTRAPEGAVTSSQTVTLTVTANDPDGDDLSYAWGASAGSLNQTSGSSVVWTAPASSSGTAQVTVTVSDSGGAQSSQTISIVYNEAVQTGDSLSYIIKNDPQSDLPVSGVTVALYNTDNKSIQQTLVSGADGIVDFGNIGRSRATVTFVYEESFTGERYIETYMDSPVFENTVYYLEDTNSNFADLDAYFDSSNPEAYIDVSLSSPPANSFYIQLQPVIASWFEATGFGPRSDIPVSAIHLQNDGKLSLLAMSYDDFNATTLLGYGFLTDQTVASVGSQFDITLNRQPFALGWSTSPATTLSSMDVFGVRAGVWYWLATDIAPASTSGTGLFASEFPVDSYYVVGDAFSNNTFISGLSKHDVLAQSVQIPMPDYTITSFVYTDATDTFSWEVTGSTPRDIIELDMAGIDQQDERSVEWTVLMGENTSSWQAIELPAPANAWVDTTDLNRTMFTKYIIVCDLDFVSGRDELMQFITAGGSLVDNTQQLFCGERSSLTSAKKSSTDEQTPTTAVRVFSNLMSKGLGHLSRH